MEDREQDVRDDRVGGLVVELDVERQSGRACRGGRCVSATTPRATLRDTRGDLPADRPARASEGTRRGSPCPEPSQTLPTFLSVGRRLLVLVRGVGLERLTASWTHLADGGGAPRVPASPALDERPERHLRTSCAHGRHADDTAESTNGSFRTHAP